jgi:hypothetical protein
MNALLEVAAGAVAVSAAARGTWSPCGLSMLATITPLGERARGRSYRAAAAWFIAGAVAGGLSLGAILAGLASLAAATHSGGVVLGSLVGVAALAALASDWAVVPLSLPIHRRQVNERWLDHYRAWVYGAGFGWQIGSGLATYITSAGVYLLVVLAVLSGSPLVALALGALHGAVRGTAVLLSARVRTSSDLLDLHRRVQARAPIAHCAVLVSEIVAACAGCAAIGHIPPAVLVTGGFALALASITTVFHSSRSE